MSEDKKEEIMEEETLNQEEVVEVKEEAQEEPKTFTQEEVDEMKKKLQGDSEKGVQKVISEKKLYERAFKEAGHIAEDNKKLVSLYDEDPKLAEIILQEYFEGQSIEEYKDSIGYEEDYSDPKVMEAKIQREAAKIANQKTIESEKKAFIEKLKMSDEEKEAFEESFGELSQLKSFKVDNITKIMEKAYKLSTDDEESLKKLKNNEVIARATASTKGGSSSKGETKTAAQKDLEAWKKRMRVS